MTPHPLVPPEDVVLVAALNREEAARALRDVDPARWKYAAVRRDVQARRDGFPYLLIDVGGITADQRVMVDDMRARGREINLLDLPTGPLPEVIRNAPLARFL